MFSELAFSGGGAMCIASYTCACELRRRGVLDNVRRVCGTSGGAIAAVLFALKHPEPESVAILGDTIASARVGDSMSLASLLGEFGLVSSARLREILRRVVMEAYLFRFVMDARDLPESEPTFRDLVDVSGVDVRVFSVNLESQKREIFSVETTPGVNVVDAVCASCCVPFLFTPMSINGSLFVDAAITDNCPLEDPGGHSRALVLDVVPRDFEGNAGPVSGFLGFCTRLAWTLIKECNARGARAAGPGIETLRLQIENAERIQLASFTGTVSASDLDSLCSAGFRYADAFLANV